MKRFQASMTFDFVAPFYDTLARLIFRRALLTAQQSVWSHVPVGADVLILGGGTGTLLPFLLRDRQPHKVLYLEASAAMLKLARTNVPVGEPVEFRQGTEATLGPTDQFDAILLPFVLDLYPEPILAEQLVPHLLASLKPDGALYVSDFDQPKTGIQRGVMTLMLLFFRLVAAIPTNHLPNWPAVLQQLGLVEQQRQTFRRGQLRSGRWVRRSITAPAPAERPSTA